MTPEPKWQQPFTPDQPSGSGPTAEASQTGDFYHSQFTATRSPACRAQLVPADKTLRWLAFVLDALISLFAILFAVIPLIGGVIAAALLVTFWLVRDLKGASPGKYLLGLQVVNRDGQPATPRALVLRNLPFAGPQALQIIPYLGILLSLLLAFPISMIEHIMVLATGERIGDRLAGTMVVKREAR